MGVVAIQTDNKVWMDAARVELINAVRIDYSSADLLLKLIAIDLKLEHTQEAQFFYEQFKRVDPVSPVIQLVEHAAHQQKAAPSPSNP